MFVHTSNTYKTYRTERSKYYKITKAKCELLSSRRGQFLVRMILLGYALYIRTYSHVHTQLYSPAQRMCERTLKARL